jgi:hypothetical protein
VEKGIGGEWHCAVVHYRGQKIPAKGKVAFIDVATFPDTFLNKENLALKATFHFVVI